MHTQQNPLKYDESSLGWDGERKNSRMWGDIMWLCKHLSPFIMDLEPHESSSHSTFRDFRFSLIRKRHVRWQNSMCSISFTFLYYESMMTLSDATFPIMVFMFHRCACIFDPLQSKRNILMIKMVHCSCLGIVDI